MTEDDNSQPDRRTTETDGGTTVQHDDIYTTEEVGKQYRESVYYENDYNSLEEAPDTSTYPRNEGKGSFRFSDMPKVPKISHIVGPSAIMLGASLGSGEMMFWPTIIAEGSWALYWAFWVGVLTQFFINTELQRWTIATGESIFGAFNRLSGIWPWFFLVFGLFNVGWPGWAASGSEVFAVWTGIVPRADWWIIGVISMAIIWLSYQAGPLVYNIVEKAQIVLMFFAIIIAVALMFILGTFGELVNVPIGAVQFGTLPSDADFDIATFLGGLAYAGAGGYTNLAQGVWAREKGYGMGSYQGRIKNPLRTGDDPETVSTGYAFKPTETNLKRWKAWWKVTQQEHFLTFVVGILIVATIAMTISAQYAGGQDFGGDGVTMWLDTIIPSLGAGSLGAWMLYALLFIALFSTQYAITEVFVRNSADIIYQRVDSVKSDDMGRVFLGLLTVFTLWGMVIIGLQFSEPWIILVIGAAAAGVMMWPYNALTIILNTTRLPEHLQPGWGRVIAMWWATGFFGYFSVLLIGAQMAGPIAEAAGPLGSVLSTFTASASVVGSGVGGYLLWVLFIVIQVYTMYRSGRAKLDARGTVEDADEAQGFLA